MGEGKLLCIRKKSTVQRNHQSQAYQSLQAGSLARLKSTFSAL